MDRINASGVRIPVLGDTVHFKDSYGVHAAIVTKTLTGDMNVNLKVFGIETEDKDVAIGYVGYGTGNWQWQWPPRV